MVNINKLRGRMVEHEVNADKMASLLGINRATFFRKTAAAAYITFSRRIPATHESSNHKYSHK